MKKRKNFKTTLLMTFFLLASCAGPKENSGASTTTDQSSTTTAPSDSPLYLKIETQWESGTATQQMGLCALAATDNNGLCNVSIPEGQLFYSNVKFTAGTNNAAECPIVTFAPYYYQRSADAHYKPAGADAEIDCSGATLSKLNAKCFGGAAPALISDFPKNAGYYFLSHNKNEATYTLNSENSIRWYDIARVNYLVTNNLAVSARGNAVSLGGANDRIGDASQWVDYKVTCTNLWGHVMHSIILTISDENRDANGGLGATDADDYKDWF